MLRMRAFCVVLPCILAAAAPQCDDTTSFMQTSSSLKTNSKQPVVKGAGPTDPRLQAPMEGGPFSKFFNERTQGHGIHKWLQYFPAYMRHFQQFIGKEVHILEIGIQSGGSLDMWKSVFGPNAHVYGADIDPNTKLYEDKVTKVFIGDQADPKFWENIKKEVPRIDILIDDGGHSPAQQTATLGMMLEHLSPNGIYVTEDIHGQDNQFWHALKLNQLDVEPFHFKDLGKLVHSVHVYPYLLVIEKTSNSDQDATFRQLGIKGPADVPTQMKAVITGTKPQEQLSLVGTEARRQLTLEHMFGTSFDLRAYSEKVQNQDLSPILMALPPRGWLVAQNEDDLQIGSDMATSSWDDKTDSLLAKSINDFKMLHEGTCCNPDANLVQQSVDSLHIYPHLLIAQRTDEAGMNRLVRAPAHGTIWNPLPPAIGVEMSKVQQKEAAEPK